jgi:hypothetical protein
MVGYLGQAADKDFIFDPGFIIIFWRSLFEMSPGRV